MSLHNTLAKAINFDPTKHKSLAPFFGTIALENDLVVISLICETRDKKGEKIELTKEKDVLTEHEQFVDSEYDLDSKILKLKFDLGKKKEVVLELAKYSDTTSEFISPANEIEINSKKELIQTWKDYIIEVDLRKAEKLDDIEKAELEIRRIKDNGIVFDDLIIKAKKANLL